VKIEAIACAKSGSDRLGSLTVEVTLPDAVAEPSISLGTSVFAAGRIALNIGKKWLMRAGLSQQELAQIDIANVVLDSAAITYLLPVSSFGQTMLLMRGIRQHGLLVGLKISSQPKLNRTTYRVEEADPRSADADPLTGTAIVLDWRAVQSHVCLHVSLNTGFLQRRGWTALESWRSAYKSKRYQLIFDTVTRGMLRLDGKVPLHPEPRSDRYDVLSTRNAELLREHIAGRDTLGYGGFPMCAKNKEKSDAKAWRASRLLILTCTGIDIRKPWGSYRSFRPRLLMKTLKYPGDYNPPSTEASIRFCKRNWLNLLDRSI